MNRLKPNKYGFSLIEFIVGLIIFAIVSSGATAIFLQMSNVQREAIEFSEYNTLIDDTANYIVNDLLNATESINPETGENLITIKTSSEVVEYSVVDGSLYRNNQPVISVEHYKGKHIAFAYATDIKIDQANSSIQSTIYNITITLREYDDALLLDREYSVKPMVLNQYQK
jgi:prepilin-type N-terminal cleavage/methylation domain-containing protein